MGEDFLCFSKTLKAENLVADTGFEKGGGALM